MASKESSKLCSMEVAAVAQANNHLAMNIYKLLSKEKENVFFSPFSLSTALAMLFCGARGDTSKEMRDVLGYEMASISDDDVRSSFGLLLSVLAEKQEAYTLACANSVLAQRDFAVKEEYKFAMKDSFKALLLEVDFMNESEQVVNQINEWVKGKTNDMIPHLLDSLDPSTVMVLLNAVYFKGSWLHQFQESATFLQNFYNKGIEGNAKQVEMMHLKKPFPFIEKESFQALQLPYKGGEIAMLILLPRSRDGLEVLESHLAHDFVEGLRKEMHERKVEVSLPKFRMEYFKSLKEQLQSMGMNRAFEVGAELGGLSDSDKLEVSQVVHKAVLVVNEEGCEAAAATGVLLMKRCLRMDPTFIVDHPFAFVIYDVRSDLILFMGRVEEL